jgi:hypothetical protein
MFPIMFLFAITVAAAGPAPLVSPQLHQRLVTLQRISNDIPTVRMILVLLERDPAHQEPQVVKRLIKLIDSYRQQVISLTSLYVETRVTEQTSQTLTDVVLFLAQDDRSLFLRYMTRKEQRKLVVLIERYRASHWPENRQALEDVVVLLRAAKTLRDMIVRLGTPLDVRVPETRTLVRETLSKMKQVCRRDDKQQVFTTEVNDYLLTLSALLVDANEQKRQLRTVLSMWHNTCIDKES